MNAPATAARASDLTDQLALLEGRFAERSVGVAGGVVSYRTCGAGPATVVLLHGISSGAASWLQCALALEDGMRVVAWNAPGYGSSTPLPMARPKATDYATRLQQMLCALEITDCVLVGHSLGALMAAAYIAGGDGRARRTLLADPAQGYGAPAKRERARAVEEERLGALRTLGIAGMAAKRSRLLSAHAADAHHDWVRWNMQRLDAGGYTQAVHLLCGDDIAGYLGAASRQGVSVACGALDVVTTPEASEGLARQFDLPFTTVDAAGHACYIEQPAVFAALIREQFTQLNQN
ncbi:MAG: 2-hydroxy-6-oxononadienedioate/2-hydroxy-6-oxononatrienedioate hydrolase [Herbaspirillum frisingense]|uniref:2-hydroxy-6-oxononadienedioate/2-hydroxy-6-oxononatrienedioate hydrolase n=1 Tax=Herbaspirillum frisingense TaxID=92645 RepID=A0A7V8JUX7_9BURK|nr:MAG: 2-hydroxy-6-oxononadienedioate/2-hydroxy-6-oxononatrienedioate hydrolase [Herbaspirillum frisingense]